jgi:hypothetical protein
VVSNNQSKSVQTASLLISFGILLAGCNSLPSFIETPAPLVSARPTETNSGTATRTPTELPTISPTTTETPSPSATSLPTTTATITLTPTITDTPTITVTPTYDFPDATVLEQANCRYGPGKAYLYSHGLYTGDRAEVHGRSYSGGWLWIQPENLERHCWAAASVMEVSGDVMALKVVQSKLPQSTLYGSPENVEAERDGDQVTVSWDEVWMTKDDYRGYLIEATVCQNGNLVWIAVSVDGTSYTFDDEGTCSGASSGKLYTVEKHGYTAPVDIPWPK